MADWVKLGIRVGPPGSEQWHSHAMLPTPLLLEDRIRVFFAACDSELRGRILYADLERGPPWRVLDVCSEPALDLGHAEAFDADGVNPSCVVPTGDALLLYYIGWRRIDQTTPYTLLAGLARSQDGGRSFVRQRQPILAPMGDEEFFRTAPFVSERAGRFMMLYIGGGQFFDGPYGKRLPIYSLRRTWSTDGVNWPDAGEVLLAPDVEKGEIGFGRPVLRNSENVTRLMLSVRQTDGYRLVECDWAEAQQGRFVWNNVVSPGPERWDDEMTCFGATLCCDGEELLFYNGNRFGWTGFGIAARREA